MSEVVASSEQDVTNLAGFRDYDVFIILAPIITDAYCIVETGLSGGASTYHFIKTLSILKGRRELHTYEIDINTDLSKFGKKRIEDSGLTQKVSWTLHNQDSVQGGKEWNGPAVDFLFLDSDHSESHVNNELNAWIPHISPSAIVVTDDVNYNDHDDGPRKAFKRYSDEHPEWKSLVFQYSRGMGVLFRQ